MTATSDATQHDLPPLPPGFKRTSGKSGPREGKWHIQLRGIGGNGFADTRVAYEVSQIRWIWGYHAGDVVAVRRAQ